MCRTWLDSVKLKDKNQSDSLETSHYHASTQKKIQLNGDSLNSHNQLFIVCALPDRGSTFPDLQMQIV